MTGKLGDFGKVEIGKQRTHLFPVFIALPGL